ncbi:hypothetical protein [Carboxylicivirga caseinilyticus]|uniref:hypothetical protein n=1 Tax=Carboxylicivirga caseinilyticus TaxID=3417572 RepID=UPI003D32C760|nr:hypothetical protein [Marinilabiliaceae bacterium A049]
MKGDNIIIDDNNIQLAKEIIPHIIDRIKAKDGRYIISVAGESGSGKSTNGKALEQILSSMGIKSKLIGQDDYFVLPPKSNDARRREDSEWLGPHVEVNMLLMDRHLVQAISGVNTFVKPLVDYYANSVEDETVDLTDVKVILAEGTYTSLLKHVDTRIFMAGTRVDTLQLRKNRNRGSEANDPFVEEILKTEHKIIAGHALLADIVVTKDFEVVVK